MLDTETKRRIDTARDILVGKVPDPKSQVEQITIALIYKFMDDMDAESEELGGNRKFFAGDFERYGWVKLMRAGLGGHETLNMYAEAITRMPENPGIPLLFRDIFKNAYLPYRDPETLKMFLKVIDEFNYDHSERLGDAFEYLLSVLGSQGDAGQFRTPRHIIDFMVKIIDPKKNETVLDPACGTAGFLISSYKHILKANTDEKGHSTLTPEEKGRLAQNFTGYDISPDMVRLSLVNMYLHGFTDPHIHEYDTLSSLERWNQYADVVLANPPFMSPKGGIQPHKRFSVQSKRSEVLFVDYMAEHLTPNGRAAIIVPEGIIFQSGTAYVQLRKMLVEKYLVAVISLPAGVFNPYAGVKTSILVLDETLAKKTKYIGFYKIDNDGYSLGTQRKPLCNEKGDQPELCPLHSDLPRLVNELREFFLHVSMGTSEKGVQPYSGLLIDKKEISSNGDYSFSLGKYTKVVSTDSIYPKTKIADVCNLIGGATPSKNNEEYWKNGSIKWISSKFITGLGQISGYELITPKAIKESSTRIAPKNSTIIITRVSVGKYAAADDDYAINQDLTALVSKDNNYLEPNYLQIIAPKISKLVELNAEGIGVRGVTRDFLSNLLIPLPPLDVQREIIAEIEGYQKVIDGARAVVENYRPHIHIEPDWPMVELGSISEWITKGTTPTTNGHKFTDSGVNFIKIENIYQDGEIDTRKISFIDQKTHDSQQRSQLMENDILFSIAGSLGIVGFVRRFVLPANTNQALAIIRVKNGVLPRYIFHFLRSKAVQSSLSQLKVGVAQYNLSLKQVSEIKIPLPSITIQKEIVAETEAEVALVNANRELIARFEQKIQTVLAHIWGEGDIEMGED